MNNVKKLRRIIYNDDGGAMKHMKTSDIQDYLGKRLAGVVGTQVDTVSFCGHDDWAKVFYPSEINGVELNGSPGLKEAIRQGKDPLAETIAFCHKNKLEVFYSFRMNDIHDSYDRGLGKFKREHPEWLLGKASEKYPARSVQEGIWSSLDFAVPEVRQHIKACIEEVCRKYDVDGLDFDYGRNASLFRPTFEGFPVEQKHRDILTDFHRQLRRMAEGLGNKRGRPFLLAAMVPETVKIARDVGMDVEVWLKEELIDILIAGNGYVPFGMACSEMIDIGHKYGVQVYPRLDVCTNDGLFWRHLEAWRAAAMNFWAAGADGIYLFNAYANKTIGSGPITYDNRNTTDIRPLLEIGDPQNLANMDKLYAVDVDRSTVSYGSGDIIFYMPRNNIVPMSLLDKESLVRFFVADDLELDKNKGILSEILLRMEVQGLTNEQCFSFKLNATPLSDKKLVNKVQTEPGNHSLTYNLKDTDIAKGQNVIQLSLKSQNGPIGMQPILSRVELWIRYK